MARLELFNITNLKMIRLYIINIRVKLYNEYESKTLQIAATEE